MLNCTACIHLQARDPIVAENGGEDRETSSSTEAQPDFLGQLLQTSYRRQRPGEGELRHDTEGWHSLESSFKALQVVPLPTLLPSLCHVVHPWPA